MKKLFFLTTLSLPILLVTPAFAVSTANVEVRNNVSSSSNTSNSTKSTTKITVETNGEVTHYESDEPGSVSVKSVNGESEIKVNGKEVVSPKPTNQTDEKVSPTTKPTIVNEDSDNDGDELDEKEKNQIIEAIETIKEKINFLEEKLSSFFD